MAGTERGGVLTHGSVLAITSNPAPAPRPVSRGKWILENLLGERPARTTAPRRRQPQRGERRPPACTAGTLASAAGAASHGCHLCLVPRGRSIRSASAWKTSIRSAAGACRERRILHRPPSGTLPDGRSFRGPNELPRHPDRTCWGTSQPLLDGEAASPMPSGRELQSADALRGGSRIDVLPRRQWPSAFSSLVLGIVTGDLFRKVAFAWRTPMTTLRLKLSRRTVLRRHRARAWPFRYWTACPARDRCPDPPRTAATAALSSAPSQWQAHGRLDAGQRGSRLVRPVAAAAAATTRGARRAARAVGALRLRPADSNGDGAGDHARAMATFLTGCRPHRTAGA